MKDDLKLIKNKPRIFANTVKKINKEKVLLIKVFLLYVNYRKNDKCPPWTIQATKMLHDNKKKQFIMIMH